MPAKACALALALTASLTVTAKADCSSAYSSCKSACTGPFSGSATFDGLFGNSSAATAIIGNRIPQDCVNECEYQAKQCVRSHASGSEKTDEQRPASACMIVLTQFDERGDANAASMVNVFNTFENTAAKKQRVRDWIAVVFVRDLQNHVNGWVNYESFVKAKSSCSKFSGQNERH